MNNHIIRNRLTAFACGVMLLAGPAQALILEEVVVTAQKREQSTQDIGIAITALSGDTLEAMGMQSSNDIAAKIPNLSINSPAGEGGVAVVFVRGVGLNDFATNNTGPVGFYIDEVYAGSSNAQVTTLFDIERIEVLKGPQGTLYGRNTTGGALNIISRKPTEELTGYLKGSYGNYDAGNVEYKVEGAISGPLSDTLGGRVALVRSESEGYMKNRVTGDYVEKDNWAGRALLDWVPTDELSVSINLHGSRNDSDADYYNSSLDADFYEGYSDIKPVIDMEQYGGSVRLEYSLTDSIELVSITAYDDLDKLHQEDADMLPFPIIHTEYGVETETWSQELRLTGSTDSSNWIAGAYYWTDELVQDQGVDLTGAGLPVPYVYHNTQETDTWALFGQVEYDLSESLVLTAGLRYTYLEVDFSSAGTGTFFLDSSSPTGISQNYQVDGLNLDDDAVSGKLGLNWHANDDVMLYGSITMGFKGAGFNGNFHIDVDEIGSYDSEDLLAYEIGIKSSLLDGTAQLNAAIFYYDYQDAQIFNNAPIPGVGLPANSIRNSDVDMAGADLDFTWAPTVGLYFQAGVGYLDATYAEDIVDPVTGPLLIDGNRVQNSPEWSAFALVNYEWVLGDSGFLSAQLDASYSGDVYFSTFEDIDIGQEAYTISNARLAYRTAGESIEVAVWAKNLSNEEYASYAFDLRSDFGFIQYARGVPRTLGVDLKYTF